jgi:hypothetical protein
VIRLQHGGYEIKLLLLSSLYYYYYYYCLNAIGLKPGSSGIHLHTNSTQNTEDGTHVTITRKNNYKEKIEKCGPCPVFASYTLAFALQLRKNHGKPSVRVVEKCPNIPVAVACFVAASDWRD